ncbi:hypothetical protein, partial [Olavius algarvensis spirochete endosymbiont]|uniref:hypothetical protein n=1 Tax=Olavius algarvensis spirochete endosymbiont TaxID=260710 RepID=UPI0011CE6786
MSSDNALYFRFNIGEDERGDVASWSHILRYKEIELFEDMRNLPELYIPSTVTQSDINLHGILGNVYESVSVKDKDGRKRTEWRLRNSSLKPSTLSGDAYSALLSLGYFLPRVMSRAAYKSFYEYLSRPQGQPPTSTPPDEGAPIFSYKYDKMHDRFQLIKPELGKAGLQTWLAVLRGQFRSWYGTLGDDDKVEVEFSNLGRYELGFREALPQPVVGEGGEYQYEDKHELTPSSSIVDSPSDLEPGMRSYGGEILLSESEEPGEEAGGSGLDL